MIRQVGADAVLPVRAAVLRPGLPPDRARYREDPGAVHLAAFDGDRVVGCVTVFAERYRPPEGGAAEGGAWRLRGMATLPEVRGTGWGGALLVAATAAARTAGAPLLWCNARAGAVGFYARYGFTAVGDWFSVEPAGAHRVMLRRLST